MVALLLGTYVFKAIGSNNNFTATYNLVAATRLRLADHLRRLPMGFWSKRRLGSTSAVLTDEFALYSEVATHSWGLVVANIALPAALAAVLLVADWRLAAVVLAPVPLALLAIPWSYRRLNRAGDQLFADRRAVLDALVEYIGGIETLRSLGATDSYRARIEGKLETLERQQMRVELAPAPAVLTFGLLVHLGFSLVLWAGSAWVGDGLPPARFLLVAILSVHFTRTLSELVLYLTASRHAGRTLERMRQLFAQPEQPDVDGGELPRSRTLEVAEVSFAYAQTPALHDVSVRFPEGKITALVGPSGSGKSTLAHLLSRLWDVEQGAIRLGGVDIRALPLRALTSTIATVFQDVVLFQESVLDNLRLGRADASMEEVIQAAKAAHAHDFIMALPHGYDTILGPGGADLSGGQRQRLSIARAVVADAPILILDEATASVDVHEEREIQQAIAALTRGRTVIVIAHRLWTVQDADQILVLDAGRVVEQGTHESLLGEDGLYAELWATQQQSAAWNVKTGA
nr:ABC transporter ATP-binding protein [Pseudenhygromyxa sp. WMMC2535]